MSGVGGVARRRLRARSAAGPDIPADPVAIPTVKRSAASLEHPNRSVRRIAREHGVEFRGP